MATMVKPSAATPAQLQARLGLRSSSAASPHATRRKRQTNPGKNNRRAEQRRAIREQW